MTNLNKNRSTGNEYEVIDAAINELMGNIESMENAARQNIPVVKRDLINGIISGTLSIKEDYQNMLDSQA